MHVTLTDSTYAYEHGAAHGEFGTVYHHYLRVEKRPLAAADIFGGKGWQEHLRKLVLDAVKLEEGDGMMDGAADTVREEAIDPERWDFSPAGLLVQFEPYEVASYAEGAVSVVVPWGALQGDLTDAAQAWVTSSGR